MGADGDGAVLITALSRTAVICNQPEVRSGAPREALTGDDTLDCQGAGFALDLTYGDALLSMQTLTPVTTCDVIPLGNRCHV